MPYSPRTRAATGLPVIATRRTSTAPISGHNWSECGIGDHSLQSVGGQNAAYFLQNIGALAPRAFRTRRISPPPTRVRVPEKPADSSQFAFGTTFCPIGTQIRHEVPVLGTRFSISVKELRGKHSMTWSPRRIFGGVQLWDDDETKNLAFACGFFRLLAPATDEFSPARGYICRQFPSK